MTTISQRSGAAATAMLGLGVYRPERVVTNDEICEVLDSSDEWIRSRSGISTRRYAGDDETLVEMATRAAQAALEAAGVGPSTRRPPHRWSPTGWARAPRRSTCRPAVPVSATRCRSAPTWSAAATPATCW